MSNLYFNGSQSVFLLDPSLEGQVWQKVAGAPVAFYPDNPIFISYGSSESPEFLEDVLQLGDGYEQVTESGIRPVRNKFTILFANKSSAVLTALRRFFQGERAPSVYDRRPSEFFWFKVPEPFGNPGDEFKRFRAKYSTTASEYNSGSVSAEFTESFEP